MKQEDEIEEEELPVAKSARCQGVTVAGRDQFHRVHPRFSSIRLGFTGVDGSPPSIPPSPSASEPSSDFDVDKCDWGDECYGNHSYSLWRLRPDEDSSVEGKEEVDSLLVVDQPQKMVPVIEKKEACEDDEPAESGEEHDVDSPTYSDDGSGSEHVVDVPTYPGDADDDVDSAGSCS